MALDLLCRSAVVRYRSGWSACPLNPAVFEGIHIFSKSRHQRTQTQTSLPNRHIRFCETDLPPHIGRAEARPEDFSSNLLACQLQDVFHSRRG